MADTVVNAVLAGLTKAGVRAGTAWPGQAAPHLTEPAVAVSLFQVNQQERVTEVLVRVLCPAAMGGGACEEEGLRITEILTGLGASCVQEECEYDARSDLFTVPIYAAFTGGIWEAAWIPGGDLTVKLNTAELFSVVGFTAEQSTEDPTVTPVKSCGWKITIEEFFYPGYAEQNTPEEPFDVTVGRTGRMETFKNCRFHNIHREDGPTGMRQIREGTAESMIYIAVG